MPLTEEEKKERNRGNVKCSKCGKIIYRDAYKRKRNKFFYCSTECQFPSKVPLRERRIDACKKWRERNKDYVLLYRKEYYQANKEAMKKKAKEYHAKHKNKKNAYNKQWKTNNTDKVLAHRDFYRESHNEKQKKYVKEIRDSYIKRLLSQRSLLTGNNIPQSLIQAKRAEIKLKRLIKE